MTKLIKFGADFCAPCHAMSTILEEIQPQFKDQIQIEDVDTNTAEHDLLVKYKIRNIPVLVIEKDGVEIWRHVGTISKEDLESKIKEYI